MDGLIFGSDAGRRNLLERIKITGTTVRVSRRQVLWYTHRRKLRLGWQVLSWGGAVALSGALLYSCVYHPMVLGDWAARLFFI